MLLFDQTILHIMNNFFTNKKMIFEDRVFPWFDRKIKNLVRYKKSNLQRLVFEDRVLPCFDRKIKNLIRYKNQIYKDTVNHESNPNFQCHF